MSLENLRQEIDRVDKEIISLLNKRALFSLQILQEKKKLNLPIYNQQREEQVLQNVMEENKGPLPDEQIKSIFHVIIESCRILEQNQKGIEQW